MLVRMETNGKLCTVGGYTSWYSHYEDSLQNIKIEWTCDPTISFLDIYPKELKSGFKRYLHFYVHCIIHSSQDMEAT